MPFFVVVVVVKTASRWSRKLKRKQRHLTVGGKRRSGPRDSLRLLNPKEEEGVHGEGGGGVI